MPTTVTASNGTTYHLWQLPDLSSPEPEIGISFTTLDNELSDGYRSTRLYGSNTGVRKWKLNMPRLAGSTIAVPTVTDINGATVTREEYIWSLYAENKVMGTPFAYTDPRSGQYYLVDFEESELTYQRMKVKLYSTGLTLRQRRLSGVTIFDLSLIDQTGSLSIMTWLEGENFSSPTWTASGGGGVAATGDVAKITAGQNGLDTVRFNATTNNGYVSNGLNGLLVNEFFLVMKMRESTFSNAAGIFTSGAGSSQMLLGSSGTTKFANPGLTGYEFRLNGTEYAQSDLQAPMNTWGIVHARYETGWPCGGSDFQFGRDRATAGTYAEMEVGEIIAFSGLTSKNLSREITEYLTVKWGIV